MSSKSNPELEDFTLEINTLLSKLSHPSIPEPVVATESLAITYFQTKNKGSDILPPVIRAISADYTWIMLERPPEEIKIRYTKGYREDEDEELEFSIKVPWLVYILKFETRAYTVLSSMHIYAKPAAIITEDEILYKLLLPNVYDDGEVCLESVVSNALAKTDKLDLAGAINCVLDAFWSSNFNQDVQEVPDDQYISFLENLANHTLVDSLDMDMIASPLANHIYEEIYIGDDGFVASDIPKIQTVAEWIRFFEQHDEVSLRHLPNPLLNFMKSLVADK